MCGIAGIYSYRASAPSAEQRELLAIRDRMASRGPDGSGLWFGNGRRIGLAHRRLSIMDLSDAGAQPMAAPSGTHVVVFNGEIYNFQALRKELIDAGYTFCSNSDTEVLLHLYDQKGPDMLRDLRGMFAFAIWDVRLEELFLARDTYGIKPIYYSDGNGIFRFASSVKALISGGAISHEPDYAGQAGFFLTGSVPEPFTTYRAVHALPAGSWMKVDKSGPGPIVAFTSIANIYEQATEEASIHSTAVLEERARAAFLDSVRHHLIADVPVGAFLSAGVDSGALVGLMRDAGARGIQTLTLSFEEFKNRHDDEAPLAVELARLYGTNHATRVVTRNEFKEDLPRIIDAMDQPSIDGVNSWFASKAVSERGIKVAISGLGGDELLGGYPSFEDIPRWIRRIAPAAHIPGLGKALRQTARMLFGRTRLPRKAFSMVEYGGDIAGAYLLRRGLFLPWELPGVMGREAADAGLARLQPIGHIRERLSRSLCSQRAQIGILEASLYMRNQLLRDTDWASMAHSLEVRVPLVDATLLNSLAPLLARPESAAGKDLLAQAPCKALPQVIKDRKKTGFGVPVGKWSNLPQDRSDLVYGYSRSWARTVAQWSFSQETAA